MEKRKLEPMIFSTLFGFLIFCTFTTPLHFWNATNDFSSMKRVEANGEWSLFCPNEAPGLHEVHSEEFEALYEKYEKEGSARKAVPAQKLWYAILEAQIETGGPFMVYKDLANCKFDWQLDAIHSSIFCLGKSNQKNLGTIKSSNLCTEIIEYSSPDTTTICNLASLTSQILGNNECFEPYTRYVFVYDG